MIGEIRDDISLDTAVKAALTGHLVLSTLHTNDAPSAVTRLRDMGLAPHVLGATLRLCAAQRLVRRLCPRCREESVLGESEAALLGRPGLAGSRVWKPCGCLACAGRGYSGRIGVFELMASDPELAHLLATGAPEDEIHALLSSRKTKTLADDAAEKLLAGDTDFTEIIRAIGATDN
jgi:type II secretory ATPase GspE/PulE/Tfp pilus assembly ATPase PilB-like protein